MKKFEKTIQDRDSVRRVKKNRTLYDNPDINTNVLDQSQTRLKSATKYTVNRLGEKVPFRQNEPDRVIKSV